MLILWYLSTALTHRTAQTVCHGSDRGKPATTRSQDSLLMLCCDLQSGRTLMYSKPNTHMCTHMNTQTHQMHDICTVGVALTEEVRMPTPGQRCRLKLTWITDYRTRPSRDTICSWKHIQHQHVAFRCSSFNHRMIQTVLKTTRNFTVHLFN